MDIAATLYENGHEQVHPNCAAVLATPDDGTPEKRNPALGFLLAIKAVLFSSVVNIMLVFVPVGVAARKSARILL